MGLVVGVNSYFDISEADEIVHNYFKDIDIEVWNKLSEQNKTALILKSTKKINKVVFNGRKLHIEMPLKFPRDNYGEIIECPEDIKIAILEQGCRDDDTFKSQLEKLIEMGVSSYKVEGSSIVIDKDKTDIHKNDLGIYSDIWNAYISDYTNII